MPPLYRGHERRVPETGHLLPPDYFSGPVFADPRTGELFARHTCVVCGHHAKTWESFRAHRAACALAHPPDVLPDDEEEAA